MRLFLFTASLFAIGCSTDTFADPDSGDDGGTGGDVIVADTSIDVASCAPTWCATQTLTSNGTCTDFDESSDIPATWTPDVTVGDLTLVASPAEQCQSLHAHLGQVGGTSGSSRMLRSIAVNTTSGSAQATLDLDVMLPTNDAFGQVFYFAIRANGVSIGLARRSDGTWWLQSSSLQTALASPLASEGPVRGAFTHMQLVVAYSTNQVNASLTYQRANHSGDTINANATFVLPTNLTYLVGMEATMSTKAAQDTYYDQVVTSLQ